jgi:hypothetical protein
MAQQPNPIFADGKVLWTFTETAKKLRKHRTTIRRWADNGNLRVAKFKGRPDMVVAESVRELLGKQGA